MNSRFEQRDQNRHSVWLFIGIAVRARAVKRCHTPESICLPDTPKVVSPSGIISNNLGHSSLWSIRSSSRRAANGLSRPQYAPATRSILRGPDAIESRFRCFNAGQTLTAGTCGLTGASASGDTYLRLYDGSTQVAQNDDSCGGVSSKLVYTAMASKKYELRAGCFGGTSCGGTVVWSK